MSDLGGSLLPYEYIAKPPLARMLVVIAEHCAVGETIRPGNRTLAKWSDQASIGNIPSLLARLHADGWIAYEGKSGSITLRVSPWGDRDPPNLHPDEIMDYLLTLPNQAKRTD